MRPEKRFLTYLTPQKNVYIILLNAILIWCVLQILQVITNGVPNSRGFYVFAEGDKKSIDSAFTRAAEIIESNFVDELL